MPKGEAQLLYRQSKAAVTSDQVVTLMEEHCSVCLCHWEGVGPGPSLCSREGGGGREKGRSIDLIANLPVPGSFKRVSGRAG